MEAKRSTSPLYAHVAGKVSDFPANAGDPFLPILIEKVGRRASAIVLYGSCLSSQTRSTTSIPDFYVVVENYRSYYDSWFEALMNWILPPTIYHLESGDLWAKYNVISKRDLAHETSKKAKDVYHLGRFSKRVAIAWARDRHGKDTVIQAQMSAMRSVARRVFFSLPKTFSLSDMVHQALNISYLGEFRVEAEDKVDRIYQAEKEYYDEALRLILQEMSGFPWCVSPTSDGDRYQREDYFWFEFWGRYSLRNLIRRSRTRTKLRWPKGMVSVPNWIDYVLAKIERTHGITIELTEKEKKYWYIYGWKYFFLLRRKKALK